MSTAPILDHMAALADPIRCRMLLPLERHELTVNEICSILQLPQSTVSRHLKTLADDGWVTSRRDGTTLERETKVSTAPSKIVIVGAGLAGAKAAQTLREEGYDGRLVLVGDEPEPPYERPPLSKDFLRGESEREAARVHEPGFYEEHAIELLTGVRTEGWREGLEHADDRIRARHVADFLAGMTDTYALKEHRRLFDHTPVLG